MYSSYVDTVLYATSSSGIILFKYLLIWVSSCLSFKSSEDWYTTSFSFRKTHAVFVKSMFAFLNDSLSASLIFSTLIVLKSAEVSLVLNSFLNSLKYQP